jgi:hypothetical protein
VAGSLGHSVALLLRDVNTIYDRGAGSSCATGAKVATHLSNATLSRIFGVALLAIALKMIFSRT